MPISAKRSKEEQNDLKRNDRSEWKEKQREEQLSCSNECHINKEIDVNLAFKLELWKAQLQERFEERLREAKTELERQVRKEYASKNQRELHELEQTRKELERVSIRIDESGANLSRRIKEFEEKETAFARRRDAIANEHAAQLLRVESQARQSVEAATLAQDALHAQVHEKDVEINQLKEKIHVAERSYDTLQKQSARYLVEGGEMYNATLVERERQLLLATSTLRETQLQLANRLDEIDRLRRENEAQERQLRVCQDQVESLTQKFNEVQDRWFTRERAVLDEQVKLLERHRQNERITRLRHERLEPTQATDKSTLTADDRAKQDYTTFSHTNKPNEVTSQPLESEVRHFIELLAANPHLARALMSNIKYLSNLTLASSSPSATTSVSLQTLPFSRNKYKHGEQHEHEHEHSLCEQEIERENANHSVPVRHVVYAEQTNPLIPLYTSSDTREVNALNVLRENNDANEHDSNDDALYVESISTPSTMRQTVEDQDNSYTASEVNDKELHTENNSLIDSIRVETVQSYTPIATRTLRPTNRLINTRITDDNNNINVSQQLPPRVPENSSTSISHSSALDREIDLADNNENCSTREKSLRPLPDDFVRSLEHGSSNSSTTRAEMLIFVEQLKRNRQKLLDTGVYTETHNVVREMTEKIRLYEQYLANHL